MAKDYYDFDTTPIQEPCAQVIQGGDYMVTMRAEAKRMIGVCRKLWPNMEFKIATNPHEFGEYLSIRVYFDDNDEGAWDHINQIEAEWPLTWDECNQRIAQLTEKKEVV